MLTYGIFLFLSIFPIIHPKGLAQMPEENMENTKLLPLGTEQGLEETEYPSFDLCLGENMVSPLVAQHRQWLKTIRHEVPNPKIPFKVAVYMANIEAGNEQQLVIKRLVESYSLSIGPTKAYGVICAVATLERIYTKYGYHVLDRTLRLCVGTWEGDIDSLGANVLAGVARMVVAFGDQLRDETFKERVGFMSVRQLSRIAKERGAGSLCYAEAMLVAYNRKCKYTLRMTKLHSGKVAAEDDFVEENEEPLADDPVLEE